MWLLIHTDFGSTRDYSDPIGSYTQDFASDHWITVTGARRDEQGNIAGFEIVDSGGGKITFLLNSIKKCVLGQKITRLLIQLV